MKPKTMILMVVAVVCGLGASYMTSKLLAERNKKEEEPSVDVLVAKARIPSWQPIKDPEQYFEIKKFPQSVAPSRPVSDPAKVVNQRLNKPLDEGKPLTESDLLTKEQVSLAESLLPGQRAIAIKVTTESLVAGFVLPGTRVDVVCTTRGADASSRILLQHMLVLAVDTQDKREAETRTIIGQTVTLAATPEEAIRLSLAQSVGELRLLLKEAGNNTRTNHVVVKLDDLSRPVPSAGDKEVEKPKPPTTALPPVPDLPKEKEEAKVPVKVEAPKAVEKKRKRHVMTIVTGASREKFAFPLGKTEEDDDGASTSSAKKDDKPREPLMKPVPVTPPAPLTPIPAAPAPSSGRPTRSGRGN